MLCVAHLFVLFPDLLQAFIQDPSQTYSLFVVTLKYKLLVKHFRASTALTHARLYTHTYAQVLWRASLICEGTGDSHSVALCEVTRERDNERQIVLRLKFNNAVIRLEEKD